MALALEHVGKSSDTIHHSYGSRDVILYALGVGARIDELDTLYENRGPKVLPTFACVPSFQALIERLVAVKADMRMVVHGEQTIRLHRPIPAEGTFSTVATIASVYDKGPGKGAVVVVEAKTRDDAGNHIFDNLSSIFIRGAGGFGGDRGPETEEVVPPAGRAPTFEHAETTSPEQAALYRLSGDLNPLHIDPDLAKKVGFERPILHGLCTYGYAGRALLRHACGGNPDKLRTFSARFAGVVFPGDTLVTRGWDMGGGRWILQVSDGDRAVITHSQAEVVA